MRWKSFLTNSTDKAMSNDANKLKNRQEIRKYLVFAGMFLLFIGCMWWIFAPSEEDRQEKEKNAGFNTELPDPRGAGSEADKITAYEQADMRRREEEKMRTLEDFSAMADEPEPPAVEIESAPECPSGGTSGRNVGSYRRSDTFSSSHSAYNDINATLGSFYETPEEDPEKEALKAEVEQLRQAAAMQQPAQMTYEEQVALLEKSYELAARYTPGNTGTESPVSYTHLDVYKRQALLGLTDKERAQILSINMANNPSRRYKEVWIGLGGTQSAVYATEVSLEELSLIHISSETDHGGNGG